MVVLQPLFRSLELINQRRLGLGEVPRKADERLGKPQNVDRACDDSNRGVGSSLILPTRMTLLLFTRSMTLFMPCQMI